MENGNLKKTTLNIKYYVPFDNLMNKTELLQVEPGSKITDVFTLLARKYTGFDSPNIFDRFVVFLNGMACRGESQVKEGDEVSIIAFLMGG
jgi:hypothetical protein